MKIIPTRLLALGALLGILAAVLFVAATDAQAHHVSKSQTGTYWKCKSNGTKSKGTTKVHVHHKKPSRQHTRRHKCVKRTRFTLEEPRVIGAPVKEVVRETTVQVVYVPAPSTPTTPEQPKPCGQPCEPKPPCEPPPPPSCKEDTHKNPKHKCKKGRGHYKDHDREDDD